MLQDWLACLSTSNEYLPWYCQNTVPCYTFYMNIYYTCTRSVRENKKEHGSVTNKDHKLKFTTKVTAVRATNNNFVKLETPKSS